MVAGLARSDLHTSYRAGAGKLREHALVFGSHVIAIDSIGSVTLVERGRAWWLAFLGLIISGGAASQVPAYGVIAWAGVGVGTLAIIVNMLVPIDRHLSIGTSDGHITTIDSNNSAFLRRMLDVLTEKINSRNPSLLAAFDISSGTVHLLDAPQSAIAPRAAEPERELLVTVSDVVANDVGQDPAAPSDSTIQLIRSVADVDETLFANDPEPAQSPRVAPETGTAAPRLVMSALQEPAHDPLLDGPSVARPRKNDQPEWMNRPNSGGYGNGDGQSGGARWLLPVLLLAIGAGGAVAAWLVLGQSKGSSAITLLSPPEPTTIENASFAETPAAAATAPAASAPASEPIPSIAAPAASQAFMTSTPRILEPTEGVHLSGGPQLVRLAWSTLSEARTHIVEVQTFDEAAQSWIDTRGPGRLTVGSDNEVTETVPTIGRWRWRVRGVAETGEESQFSAWSVFTLSE